MEIIKDLPEVFEEFAEQRQKSFLAVKQLKDKGIPVIGSYCTYFPKEIAMAMGAATVSLCSTSDETIPAAEKDLPRLNVLLNSRLVSAAWMTCLLVKMLENRRRQQKKKLRCEEKLVSLRIAIPAKAMLKQLLLPVLSMARQGFIAISANIVMVGI